MTDVGTARVRVTGDTKRLEQDIERGTTKAASEAGKKGGKSLGSNLARGFVAVGAGALIASEISKQINAASDLGETISKTNKVFGDASAGIEAWSNTTADGIGQSKRAALDAASTFGIFGKAAGLSGNDLVGFSTRLTTLASDLASINNTRPEDAVQALGAALRGEAEPIRAYGVLLDDATLRQEALALGLTKTTKDALTPQQRVLAAQAAIFKQTSVAQGDFADTSDGLANSQRILAANLEDARAELGQQWLPIALEATTTATDLLKAFGGMPEPIQQATIALALAGGAALLLAPRIAATVEALVALRAAMAGAAASTALAAAPLVILSGGLLAAASSAVAAQSDINDLNQTFDPTNIAGYKKEIDDVRGRLEDVADGVTNVGDVFEMVGYGLQGIFTGTNPLIEMDEAMRRNIRTLQGYETALVDIGMVTGANEALVRQTAEAVWDENRSYVENKDAVAAAVAAKAQGTDGAQKLAEAELAAADGAATAADKTKAYKDALDALNAPALDVRASQRAYSEAIDAASESLKENGRTLDIGTEKGRANAAALDDIAKAAQDTAAAMRAKDGNDKRANETLETARKRLQKQAEAFGLTEAQAKKYVEQVLEIPPKMSTTVTAETKAATEKVKRFIREFNGKQIVVTVTTKTNADGSKTVTKSPAGVGGSAQGGDIPAYAPRWVGEQGPELFIPNRAGTVVPNYAIDDIAPKGTTIVNARIFLGDREITDIVRVEVDEANEQTALALAGRR